MTTDSQLECWKWVIICETEKQIIMQTINNKPYQTYTDRLVREIDA